MTDLAPTACRPCRSQKLRCSREPTRCARCARLDRQCSYPDPPDRKRLATVRVSSRKRRRRSISVPDPASSSQASQYSQHSPSLGTEPPPLPSREVQRLLIEFYSSHVFNAPLMFHRPSLIRQWEDGVLSQTVLLAIFALATTFAPSFARLPSESKDKLHSAGDIQDLGRRCALWAGTRVLEEMAQPTLDSIRTCSLLYLYWHAMDDPGRNSLYMGISYKAALTMAMELQTGDSTDVSSSRGDSEFLLRVFWASWMANTISSDHYTPGTCADPRVTSIPLPKSDSSFQSRIVGVEETLSSFQAKLQGVKGRRQDRESVSVLAETLKMVYFWAKIRDHIENKARMAVHEIIAALYKLDQELSAWFSILPAEYAYSRAALYEHAVTQNEPLYTSLLVVYFQCRLTLHAAHLPQLNGKSSVPDGAWPVEVIRGSMRKALESARALSMLADDFLALGLDPATLAPFIGYSMFASAVTLMCFPRRILSEGSSTSQETGGLQQLASLKLLNVMRSYWKHLDRLWTRAMLLYKASSTGVGSVDASSEVRPSSRALNSDHDILETPNIEACPEPISNSYLHYTLRKIRRPITQEDESPRSKEGSGQDILRRVDLDDESMEPPRPDFLINMYDGRSTVDVSFTDHSEGSLLGNEDVMMQGESDPGPSQSGSELAFNKVYWNALGGYSAPLESYVGFALDEDYGNLLGGSWLTDMDLVAPAVSMPQD